MLYVFDQLDKLPGDLTRRCSPHLSGQRLEKAVSYRFEADRNLSVIVYLLLRIALKENYSIDEPVVFSYEKNGKPLLRDYPQIHFSLSHCISAAACAVSFDAVGVDVQEITPVSYGLAERVLTAEELSAFKTAANPSRRFCEYWVMKESYLKKTGEGIGAELARLPADAIGGNTRFSGADYCGCVSGESETLRRVNAPELLFYTEEALCTHHF